MRLLRGEGLTLSGVLERSLEDAAAGLDAQCNVAGATEVNRERAVVPDGGDGHDHPEEVPGRVSGEGLGRGRVVVGFAGLAEHALEFLLQLLVVEIVLVFVFLGRRGRGRSLGENSLALALGGLGARGLPGGGDGLEERAQGVGVLVILLRRSFGWGGKLEWFPGLEGECGGADGGCVGAEPAEVGDGVFGGGGDLEVGIGADAEAADSLEEVGDVLGLDGCGSVRGADEHVDVELFGAFEGDLEALCGGVALCLGGDAADAEGCGGTAEELGGLDDASHAFDSGFGGGVGGGVWLVGEGEGLGLDEDEAGAASFVGAFADRFELALVGADEEVGGECEPAEAEFVACEDGQVENG